jgi:hypothetical protein
MALPTGAIRPRDPRMRANLLPVLDKGTCCLAAYSVPETGPAKFAALHGHQARSDSPHTRLSWSFNRGVRAFPAQPTTPASAQAVSSEEHAFRVARVVEGLEHPWGLADGEKVVKEEHMLKGVLGRLRDVRTGPDRFRLAAGAGASGGRSRQFCFDRACVDSGRGLVRNLRRRKRPCGFDQTAQVIERRQILERSQVEVV